MKVTADGKRLAYRSDKDSGVTVADLFAQVDNEMPTYSVLESREPTLFVAIPMSGAPYLVASADISEADKDAFQAYRRNDLMHPAAAALADFVQEIETEYEIRYFEANDPLANL